MTSIFFRKITLVLFAWTFGQTVFVFGQDKAQLMISQSGSSNYQIVLADQAEANNLNYYLNQAAETLKYCIKESTGADLAIVQESNRETDKPGIFLGATKKALLLGFEPDKLEDFQVEIKVVEQDIFLVGLDETGARDIRNFAFQRLGTVKAITLFLENFLDVKFVLPGSAGIVVPKKDSLIVPVDLSVSYKPKIGFSMSRNVEMIYDIANNLYPSHTYAHHGGHSYPEAIPVEKYGQTNPEYFYIRKGERLAQKTRPQYCFSNPKVQGLIYQELLNHIDERPAYEVVQIGQSDGFLGCSCEKCQELYGVRPKAEPDTKAFFADTAWGIKLWNIHVGMAKRFQKDRPAKMISLNYYGPTRSLPNELTALPENTIVDLSYYDEPDFERWDKIDVPGGFYVTVKNWGKYQSDGYTPKRDPDYIVDQLKRFHKNNIHGMYKMGFGELFGLEGPVYYLFAKLHEDSDLDKDQVLKDYYQHAYAKAADSMEIFFTLLHERLKKHRVMKVDWNDADLLAGKLPKKIKADHRKVIMKRYPEPVLAELEKNLHQAENTEGLTKNEKIRLQLTRIEFDYLKALATVFNQHKVFTENPTLESLEKLEALVNKRKDLIAGLFDADATPKTRTKLYHGIPLFGKSTKAELLNGWGKNSQLNEPFDWDFNEQKKRFAEQ